MWTTLIVVTCLLLAACAKNMRAALPEGLFISTYVLVGAVSGVSGALWGQHGVESALWGLIGSVIVVASAIWASEDAQTRA